MYYSHASEQRTGADEGDAGRFYAADEQEKAENQPKKPNSFEK